ncbi:methyltransferase domain-containing protein [Phyllobacterium sp. SYP-B3895]|uniref:RsmB/NOP family class I SAM-dependent RNA methyltransferase n=1 Tax=Phyllobacterium sp. SYP-B3895 TaxID=2663240 RepID=UPI001299A3BF|nr:RsmB/NOP family class I SAM-dependent RNA methyltransferase [Phyllobacterium sp. SYP-B3895]MRG54864.1 methyltransferase domain-containing protein [Phyllobacterium sp. SYP-B3895]
MSAERAAKRNFSRKQQATESFDGEHRPGLAARQCATRLLGAVIEKHTSLDGLTDNCNGHPQYMALDDRDRSLVRAILGAALRNRGAIEAAISQMIDRPLPENAVALKHLLHVAAAQILYLDLPDRAAVDLAVTAANGDPRNRRFASMVNAVLRRLSREKETFANRAAVNVPSWFEASLIAAYGKEKAGAILEIQAKEPAVDLTVKGDPQVWAERLGGLALPTGSVRLANIEGALTSLPGFAEGEWWVQDTAASLPAKLFGDITGKRVADLCAAPGGKTAQLALAGANVTALDLSANRLKRLRANLERLHFTADTVEANLAAYEPAEPFDAVLLDAPCSSTGTVRRHPDVPWTKSPEEIAKLAALQAKLLDHAVTLVRPGGIIVFSNCSLDPSEGEAVARQLIAKNPAIELVPVVAEEIGGLADLITKEGFVRSTPADLPHDNAALSGMDGFFAARFRRKY